MNVLCIAPHPDDETIGCGGALCVANAAGHRTAAVFLTSGEAGLASRPQPDAQQTREAEAEAAAQILQLATLEFFRFPDGALREHLDAVAQKLGSFIRTYQPDLVYLPHPHEWHPDHQAAVQITQAALAHFDHPAELQAYEVWTPIQQHHRVLDISSFWDRKLAALRAHVSQLSVWPYDRAVEGLNRYRGAMHGQCAYAEAFHSLG